MRLLTQAACRRSPRLEIKKQFPQRYVPVYRLVTESISYDGVQEEPEEQESHTNQGEERAEPKKEFHYRKDVIKKGQNQALHSFACDQRLWGDFRVQTSHRFVDTALRTTVRGTVSVSPNLFLTQCGNVGTGVTAPQCLPLCVRGPPSYPYFPQTHHTSHPRQRDSAPAGLPIPG